MNDAIREVPFVVNSVIVGWTHGICDDCWLAFYFHNASPARSTEPEREQCCMCGMPTTSGIYIREDPQMVRYPRPRNRTDDVVRMDGVTAAADL
jgi:hypothetical protein